MPPLKLPYSHDVATGEQCRKMDRDTIGRFGMDGLTLMETAGLQAAGFIAGKTGVEATGLFACGKGNNGGDALVAARYLHIHHRHTCHIWFPSGNEELSPSADENLTLLRKLAEESPLIHFHTDASAPQNLHANYVVDGLLGTGLSSDLRSPLDAAVRQLNQMDATVFALDIPTGMHTNTGQPMKEAVRADFTLSFGARKVGFYMPPGREHTGEVRQFDLSFPEHCRQTLASVLTPELTGLLPPLERTAEHKYSDRVLYIIAGSEGLTGAAIMAARSGWKTGVGAVFLLTPRGLLGIYEKALPDIIKMPVGERNDYFFTASHEEEALKLIQQKEGVLLIGPGLGRNKGTQNFTATVLSGFNGKTVIDADALLPVRDLQMPDGAEWILTPHPGELRSLSGTEFDNGFERIGWVSRYARGYSRFVVSKGNPTFIGTPEGKNYITGYDTSIFARTGFGDVLSGQIAGNLAITDSVDLGIVRTLLNGHNKAISLRSAADRPLEPNDLI